MSRHRECGRVLSSVEEDFRKSELREAVRALLKTLPSALRTVLSERYGLERADRELSELEIAQLRAVRPERVAARLGLALRRLQKTPARKRLLELARSLLENID